MTNYNLAVNIREILSSIYRVRRVAENHRTVITQESLSLFVFRIHPSKRDKGSRKDPAQKVYLFISILLHGRKTPVILKACCRYTSAIRSTLPFLRAVLSRF